jgi:hypothetical protein
VESVSGVVRRILPMSYPRARRCAAFVFLFVLAVVVVGGGMTITRIAEADTPVACVERDDPSCVVDVTDPGGAGAVTTPQGSVTTVGAGCTPPVGPGIPAGVDCSGCIWGPYLGVAADAGAHAELVAAGGKGEIQQQDCYPGPTTTVEYFPPDTAPPPPGVSAAQLGGRAVSLLPFPTVVTDSAPGAQGRAFAETFVNVPTFFWAGPWQTVTATANDGFKAVTATAVPSYVTWALGDGESMTCAGPGVPWSPGVTESYCSYTYAMSSVHQPQVGGDVNDRPFQVSATVTYQVSWTCAGLCGGVTAGAVGAVAGPTTLASLVVGEIQTVVTG